MAEELVASVFVFGARSVLCGVVFSNVEPGRQCINARFVSVEAGLRGLIDGLPSGPTSLVRGL